MKKLPLLYSLLVCVAGTVFDPAYLAGQRQNAVVLTSRWEESWERYPRVSGRLVPGIMVGDPRVSVGSLEPLVQVSRSEASVLCAKVTSRDGHFQASAMFPVEAGADRTFVLRGLREKRVRRYVAEDLAIRVEVGASCEDVNRVLAPATWSRSAVRDTVLVYVNVRPYTRVVWLGAAGNEVEAPCAEMGGVGNVAYNRVCQLPAGMVPVRTRVTVERRQDGSVSSESFWMEYPQ
jgi:hypothetical protein